MVKPIGTNKTTKRYVLPLTLVIAATLAACANQTYTPKAISAQGYSEAFEAKRLTDPEFLQYLSKQQIPPPQHWQLSELYLAAIYFNSELRLARSQWRALEASQITAGQMQNPAISGFAESNSQHEQVSPWTLGLALDIPIETGNKRQIRKEKALALSEAARIDIGQKAWKIRSQLKSALLEETSAYQQIKLLKNELLIREEILALLETRFKQGYASSLDVSNTKLQLVKTQQLLSLQVNRLPQLRAAIATTIGLPFNAIADIKITPVSIDSPTPMGQLPSSAIQKTALLNRLDILSALKRYEAREANLKLEIAKQIPDFSLGPSYSFDQGNNRWSLGFSTILALLNKNEGPIAEARAQREVAADEFNVVQSRVISELSEVSASYEAAYAQLEKAQVLRSNQAALSGKTQKQFDAGLADRLELTTSKLENLIAQQNVLNAQLNIQTATARLEDALQIPLDQSIMPSDSQWLSKQNKE